MRCIGAVSLAGYPAAGSHRRRQSITGAETKRGRLREQTASSAAIGGNAAARRTGDVGAPEQKRRLHAIVDVAYCRAGHGNLGY